MTTFPTIELVALKSLFTLIDFSCLLRSGTFSSVGSSAWESSLPVPYLVDLKSPFHLSLGLMSTIVS